MEPKDATQTKNGTPWRFYADDAGGKYPIHGAYWSETEMSWIPNNWTADGNFVGWEGGNRFDLDLTDWREKIPWEWLVDEIEWVAMDKDGEWFGYQEVPKEGNDGWYRGGTILSLEGFKMPKGPADWTQAIAQRPKGEDNGRK